MIGKEGPSFHVVSPGCPTQETGEIHRTRMGRLWVRASLSLFLLFVFARPDSVWAEGREKLAVLPFAVYTQQPLKQLQKGLQEMLGARLAAKGFQVKSPEAVNRHELAFKPNIAPEEILEVGRDLEVDWVISGSLTQIGTQASLDLKVFDVSSERAPVLIYMVAENLEVLGDAVDRVVASIQHQITGVVQVDSIQVQGNQRVEKAAILAVVETRKGDSVDEHRLNRDLREVYRMGYFDDVRIETEEAPTGKAVIIRVVEKPSITKIVFEGNKKIEEEELKKEIGIKLYAILDHNEIRRSTERLKEYYRQKGYYNAEIREQVEDHPNNEVQLKYRIDEKEKVFVTKIAFVGNEAYDEDKLKGMMETSEKGFFSWLTDSGYLDRKKLEFDAFKLTSFYHNNGYVKAKLGDPKIDYEKGKGLTITIQIQEGLQYRIRKVEVEGELIRPAGELLKEVQISKEKVFNRETVRKDISRLKDLYSDEGFAYSEVTPMTREDDETALVDITYRISKGPKVRFERITVTGNTITRDKVIRRELKVIEGEYFSGKALKRSTQNLNRLGFFENVEVQTKKGAQEDQMVLNINVKEKPTGSLSFGAGYSSVDGVVGMAQVAQNNLFGYGQLAQVSLKLGGKTNQFDILFREPWLLDRPLSGEVRGFKWEREYDEYTKNSTGGHASVGFPVPLDDFTRGAVTYTYEDADISDVDPWAAYEIRAMEGRSVTSSVTLALSRNSTDKPWNATSGSINSVSMEYAGGVLGGDNYFTKYLGRSAWYFPLFWETVFSVQGRWGYIQKREGGELPVYEKFYLGGINTVRGFEYGDISPRDPITGDKIGGEKMMVYNVEYRFPLIKEQGVIGLIFFDAGNVFTEDESYTFSGIRRSVGGGVRWYSPMGPLRLEWGYNLDPQEGEAESKWDFSVGTMF